MKLHALLLLAVSPWTMLAAESSTSPSPPSEGTPVASASVLKFDLPIFEFAKLDQTPVIKFRVAPQYPSQMRKAQIEGEVLVDFVVTTEGKVVKVSVVRSSRRDFEAAAVTAVSRWKFAPGTKNGRPVNTHMQVPIGFSLN